MVFERENFIRLNKFRLLLISLTFQNTSKVNISDNTFNFCWASEIERDLISKRTKEALRARKVAGVKLGRPRGAEKSKLDAFKEEIVALLKNGSSKKFVADRYGTSQVNLYNWIRKNNLNVATQSV